MNSTKHHYYINTIQHPFNQTLQQQISSFLAHSKGTNSILLIHIPNHHYSNIKTLKSLIESLTKQTSLTFKSISQTSIQISYENYSQKYFTENEFNQLKRNLCFSSQMNSLFGNQNDWKQSMIYCDTFLIDLHLIEIINSYVKNAKIPLIICSYSNDLNSLIQQLHSLSYVSSVLKIISCD